MKWERQCRRSRWEGGGRRAPVRASWGAPEHHITTSPRRNAPCGSAQMLSRTPAPKLHQLKSTPLLRPGHNTPTPHFPVPTHLFRREQPGWSLPPAHLSQRGGGTNGLQITEADIANKDPQVTWSSADSEAPGPCVQDAHGPQDGRHAQDIGIEPPQSAAPTHSGHSHSPASSVRASSHELDRVGPLQ